MLNPLHPPNVLIHIEEFFYNPLITKDGETQVEGPYCLQCWVDLEEIVELIELWKSPEIGIAYCPLCNQETRITSTFEELRNEARLKVVGDEWWITQHRDVKILEPLKNSPHQKPEPN